VLRFYPVSAPDELKTKAHFVVLDKNTAYVARAYREQDKSPIDVEKTRVKRNRGQSCFLATFSLSLPGFRLVPCSSFIFSRSSFLPLPRWISPRSALSSAGNRLYDNPFTAHLDEFKKKWKEAHPPGSGS
jgi:hypothetical protein